MKQKKAKTRSAERPRELSPEEGINMQRRTLNNRCKHETMAGMLISPKNENMKQFVVFILHSYPFMNHAF